MGAPATATADATCNNTAQQPIQNSNNHTLLTYTRLIQKYLDSYCLENAIFLGERALADFPNQSALQLLVATAYYRQKHHKQALHLIKHNPLEEAKYLCATICYEQKDYHAAERHLTKTTASSSSAPKQQQPETVFGAAGLLLLGKVCRKLHKTQTAIACFERSIQLDPFLFTNTLQLAELGAAPSQTSTSTIGTTNTTETAATPNILQTPPPPMARPSFATPNLTPILDTVVLTSAKKSLLHTPVSRLSRDLSDLQLPDDNDDNNPSDDSVKEILQLLNVLGHGYRFLCDFDCAKAIRVFTHMVPDTQTRTAWVCQSLGRAYFEHGDFVNSKKSFERMQSLAPFRLDGLEWLSTVYWQLKAENKLSSLAQTCLDLAYTSPVSHCVAGNCFSLQKDHETALVFFGRSLQLDPEFIYSHTLSGYEYMANEDFENASKCFRSAISLNDKHYNAWYGLGTIYQVQEKYDLSEYHFERAVNIHRNSSTLLCNLGVAQNANGKAYQALETLGEAFRLDPRNPQARFQRANIYNALNRYEEAILELEKVRDAAPKEASVYFAMAKVYKRLGQKELSLKNFLMAMDLDPKDNQLIKSNLDKLDEMSTEDDTNHHF